MKKCCVCGKKTKKWQSKHGSVSCYDFCKSSNGIVPLEEYVPCNGDFHTKAELNSLLILGLFKACFYNTDINRAGHIITPKDVEKSFLKMTDNNLLNCNRVNS